MQTTIEQPTDEAARVAVYPRVGLYVGGAWIQDRPAFITVRNPSTEAELCRVPGATAHDITLALAAAESGFRIWRATSPLERARTVLRASALLRERADAIATVITLEQGKTFAGARGEVERAATFLEWDAGEAQRMYGHTIAAGPGMRQLVLREPIGCVAAFTPWNVAMGAGARKIGGALSAGCSLVLKAADETPGTACALVQCFADAGVPAGVLNLLFGDPALISSTLIASPVVRMVSLTGSVGVGKHLSQLAGAVMKPVLMELGGHAPVLVGENVDDVVRLAQLAANAKMLISGQSCVSPTRFIVHQKSYGAFVDAFATAAKAVRVGDGFAPGVQMGPLINPKRLTAMEALVADAKACGARVAAGGHRVGERGCFYAPTVLADVPLHARAMTEEPFGPIGLCVPVATLEEGLTLANSLALGLASYAFTNSYQEAERMTQELDSGTVAINHFGMCGADTPFGGVKDSGIGREGGAQSLMAYTVTKTILQSFARV